MTNTPTIEYLQQLFGSQQFDELIDNAGSLLKAEPGNVRGLYWRACAFMRLEQMDAARYDLDRAIELFDEYADAYTQRGVLFFHKGELQLAMEDMDRAVELEPDNPYRYSSRAYIKAALDRIESAIQDYETAIRLDPEDAVAYNNLGLLQEQLGYKSQAQRNLEKADLLMVNEDGELVSRPDSAETAGLKAQQPVERSYTAIIRDVLTTRKGFLEYWNYLKKNLFS